MSTAKTLLLASTSAFCLGLVACGGTPLDSANLAAAAEDGKEDHATPPLAFDGTETLRPIALGAVQATQYQTSDAINALLKRMTGDDTNQNNSYFAASYLFDPKDIAFDVAFSGDTPQSQTVYQMLFRANGSAVDQYTQKFDADYENLDCRPIATGKALQTFRGFPGFAGSYKDTQAALADRKDLYSGSRVAVRSLLSDLSAPQVMNCHWDNSDDTNYDALLAIDHNSGEVRVLVAINGG